MTSVNGNTLKIISLNVRGIGNFRKRRSVFNWCRKSRADLILLQETHSTNTSEIQWQHEWGGKILFSHGTNNSKGVAIIFRNGNNVDVSDIYHDNEGRILCINFVKDELNFTLVNIYAPNIENLQNQFYDNLKDVFSQRKFEDSDRIIIGGDFNCILNAKLDKSGGIEKVKDSVVHKISNIIDSFDLIDIWRFLNPNACRFTWRQPNPLIQCRLDYFLTSNSLSEYISHSDIIPGIRTDHSAIVINVQLQKSPVRGPGLWKFNNSYLADEQYVNNLNDNLSLWLNDLSINDPQVKWEWIKFKIRDFTIKYAKKKCMQKKDRLKVLYSKLNLLEESLANNPCDEILDEIHVVKNELEAIDAKVIDGIVVRSRIRWAEKGEKSNKYFLGLEKRNCRKKQCKKLILDNGTEITCPNDILNMQREYYKNIYQSKVDVDVQVNNAFMHEGNVPKLDDVDKLHCDGKLTEVECFNVLTKMAKNKSPGNDGLSCEWYLTFWNKIGSFLVHILNKGLNKGEMSSSQRQAVITLIEKEGKDRCNLKNWRPISLLNVDYKIASKALALRVEKIIHNLIHSDQSGFVKGRYIGESVRIIQDIMDFTKNKNIPGLLLFLDFEKAFDSLEWDFLFEALKCMNFGLEFISYVKSLYTNISSCILNNGITSQYFNIGRGVRQGDPLSSYLFILSIEYLSCSIRNNPNINGIKINDKDFKIVQYADDTTCILDGEQSATTLLELIKSFSEVSGLKLNVNKSQGLWLGSRRYSNERLFDVDWPKEPVKALGVYFSYDINAAEEMNFTPKLKQIQTILNIWKSRKLTLSGKILLIKTFALSKFVYLASVTHIPETVVLQIEKIIFDFLWNGGKGFIKRSSIIGDISDGGLKMVDVKSLFLSQKLRWVGRYNNSNSNWKILFDEFLAPHGGDLVFHCNSSSKQVDKWHRVPIFYKDMLKSYFDLVNFNDDNPYTQCIWNNKHICINKKPCFNSLFLNCGIKLISDLFYENGEIIPFNAWHDNGVPNNCYLQWRSLIGAIPGAWKQALKQGFNREICMLNGFLLKYEDEYINVGDMTSKMIYSVFVKRIQNPPISQKRYIDEFDFDDADWKTIYLMPFKSCYDVRTRIFQYKINVRCLMTNSRLFKMNITDTDMCSHCNNAPETYNHLFWECVHARKIWSDFKLWYKNNCHTDINILDFKTTLFGLGIRDEVKLRNLCFILVKKVIYDSRFRNQTPSIIAFEYLIKFHYKLEKQIAINTGNMVKFISKWNVLEAYCSNN